MIVLERDRYTCQRCKTEWHPDDNKRRPDIHHILPRRLGGSDSPDNLITYCVPCHRKVERMNFKRTINRIIQVVMPEELLKILDKKRGDVPRSAYVRKLIDIELEEVKRKQ